MTKKYKATTSPILRGNPKVKRFAHPPAGGGMRYSRTRFTRRILAQTKHHDNSLSNGKVGEGLFVSSRAHSRGKPRGLRAEKQIKIYIGLVGEKGGGKDTVMDMLQELLSKYKIAKLRFQDVLTETLRLWRLPLTRENYSKLSPAFRRTFGPSTLSNVVKARAQEARADIVALSGVRWWEDLKMIRSLNKPLQGEKSFLVYVTAPVRVRFERTKRRGEKAGEKKATFAKFLKQEKLFTERFIKKIGARADVVIENTNTMDDFREKIKRRIIPLISGEKL